MTEELDYTNDKDFFIKRSKEEFEKFIAYCEERQMRAGVFNIKYNIDTAYDGFKRWGRELTLSYSHPAESICSYTEKANKDE